MQLQRAGGVIGPLLGGYIYDVAQSYVIAIVISAMALAGSGVLAWIVAPWKGALTAPRGATQPPA